MNASDIRKLFGLAVSAAIVAGVSSQSLADTIIGRNISGNSVWQAKKSPYVVTNNIRLEEGSTLLIEPGVRVELAPDKTIELRGKLTAVGSPEKPIIFTAQTDKPWGNIHFTDFSDDAVFSEDGRFVSGSIMQNCIVEKGQGIYIRFGAPFITECDIRNNASSGIRIEFGGPRIVRNHIHDNSTRENFASGNGAGIIAYTDKNVLIAENTVNNNVSEGGRHGGGGLYAYAYEGGRVVVKNNIIYGNTSDRFGGGIYAFEAQIIQNVVMGNSANERGGGIYAVDSDVRENLIQSNIAKQGGGIFAENRGPSLNSVIGNIALRPEGGGLYYFGSGEIRNNSITSNSASGGNACGGIYVSGNPTISENNILNNRGYALRVANVTDAPRVAATNNYWGETERGILHQTFDWLDDDEIGLASCTPYLDQLSPNAPPPPPLNLIATAKKDCVELSWDELAGVSFEGHKVYFGTESGYPYETMTQVGQEKRWTVKGLKPGREYSFAVSGFRHVDGKLSETGFSEEVRVRFSGFDETVALPLNISPAEGEKGVSKVVILSASIPESASPVSAFRWQMSSSREDFGAHTADVVTSGADLLSKLLIAKGALLDDHTYFWRVACRTADGSWSLWSRPTSFTTAADSPSLLGGPITSVVKLEKRLSPYRIVDNVLVMPGGTLEIEPGVLIQVAPGRNLMVHGKLAARGTHSNPITFTGDPSARWGKIIFGDLSKDAVTNEAGAYVEGCILENCTVEKGKGILVSGASPMIQSCTIAYHEGSGIAVRQGGPVIVSNDIFGNVAPTNGGGIYAYTNDIIRIASNKIHDNKAGGDGGGVFAYGYMNTSTIRVEYNEIFSNRADGDGGGIYLSRSSAVGNKLEANRADGDGGGIYATFGLVDKNTISGNQSLHGGGIYAEHNSAMTRNIVSSNNALSRFGGGVYINFWGISIENEVFTQNTVSSNSCLSEKDNGGVFVVGYLVFERNNIFGNSGSQLYNGNKAEAPPFVASQCYWGAADTKAISTKIVDERLDSKLGKVTFEPFSPKPLKFN